MGYLELTRLSDNKLFSFSDVDKLSVVFDDGSNREYSGNEIDVLVAPGLHIASFVIHDSGSMYRFNSSDVIVTATS